ncbi:MAG: hypothetical protein LBL00_03725 [Endomicrobium sp.]|nr:hypothetical protein [Endomicrobium sp.]
MKEKTITRNEMVLTSVLILPFLGVLSFEWLWNINLFLVFLSIWHFKDNNKIFIISGIMAGIVSAFSLFLKFNTAALSLGLSFVVFLLFLIFCRKKSVKYISLFASSYILTTLLGILAFFKEFSYFLKWLKISLEIASSYNTAMALYISVYVPFLIVAFILVIVYIAFMIKEFKNDSRDNYILFLICSVLVFFSFKHSFVRQDGHMLIFYTTFPILSALLYIFAGDKFRIAHKQSLKICAVICCACMMVIGKWYAPFYNFTNNVKGLFEIKQKIKNFERNKTVSLRENVLNEEWNAEIGNSSIQILPFDLSYAAANNWTSWQPNPVLQLYSAYSKTLDQTSADSFINKKAPSFILLEYETIDERNMFFDTPATWNAILSNYSICKDDGERLLLKKNNSRKRIEFTKMQTDVYKFGDTIKIPETNGLIFAKIKINTSFLGKIITMLFRGCPSDITVKYQNGENKTFRIIDDTLQMPFLINYLPDDIEQTAALFYALSLGNEEDLSFSVKEFTFKNKFRAVYCKNNIEIEWFKANLTADTQERENIL